MPAGGSGRRTWIVRSSVGAETKRPRATNAAGAQASVIAATSGASSRRGSTRAQPAAGAGHLAVADRPAHVVVAHERGRPGQVRAQRLGLRERGRRGHRRRVPGDAAVREPAERGQRERHRRAALLDPERDGGVGPALALDGRRDVERPRARRRGEVEGERAQRAPGGRLRGAGGQRRQVAAVRAAPDEPVLGRLGAPAALAGPLQRGVGVERVRRRDRHASRTSRMRSPGSHHAAAHADRSAIDGRSSDAITLSSIPCAKNCHTCSGSAPDSRVASATSTP